MSTGRYIIFTFDIIFFIKNKKTYFSPGGVARWISSPLQEQKTRVRIPPGYKVL
jgi:hypothetical protein